MEPQWNRDLEALHLKNCPECNTQVSVFFESSRIISCSNCSTVFNSETNRQSKAILGKNPNRKPANPTFLEIGQEFIQKSTFKKGDRFKIIAHIYIKSNYETFGVGEKYKGKWYYHEWLCVSQTGDYMSIVYDKEGYKFAKPIKDVKFVNLEKANYLILTAKTVRFPIEERSKNEVLYFEGEYEDAYAPGTRFNSAISGPKHLIVGAEWFDANLPESYSYFEQKPVGDKLLFKKIENANDLSTYKSKLSDYNFFRKAILLSFIGIFVLWFFSLFFNGFNIYKQEFNLAQLVDEEAIKGKAPFEISSLSSVYQLDMEVEMEAENTEVFAAVEILNENENVVNVMQWDFWKAAGISDGEKWSETSTDFTEYYSFPKKGKFSVTFHAEKTKTSVIGANDKLVFEVNKGALLSRYFIILLILLGISLIIIYSRGTGNKIKAAFLR